MTANLSKPGDYLVEKELSEEKERHAEILVEAELHERGRVAQLLFEINS